MLRRPLATTSSHGHAVAVAAARRAGLHNSSAAMRLFVAQHRKLSTTVGSEKPAVPAPSLSLAQEPEKDQDQLLKEQLHPKPFVSNVAQMYYQQLGSFEQRLLNEANQQYALNRERFAEHLEHLSTIASRSEDRRRRAQQRYALQNILFTLVLRRYVFD